MKTYKIIRFYRKENKLSRVIRRRVTLEQAQAHCRDPKTSTNEYFDGYEKE